MKPAAAARLALHLDADPDVLDGSIRRDTDSRLSIGSDVWRMVWRGQLTCAVGKDADLPTTCGAVLDVMALHQVVHEFDVSFALGREVGPIDPTGANVLVDREQEWAPTECDEALRSVRDATGGFVRIWYRSGDGWSEDHEQAPYWPSGHPLVTDWVHRLMIPRLTTEPTVLALRFVSAVNDPSLHLYPSAISATEWYRWAVRADGLQIGLVGAESGMLTVGKPGKDGATSNQRRDFIDVFDAEQVAFAESPNRAVGEISVLEAAELVRGLLNRWRPAPVPGAPIMHRGVVDEHAAEARILKGIIELDQLELIAGDEQVARGSQFPTLWSANTAKPKAKYLDAMLRHHSAPCAVELKVGTGGQGRYYRRSLVQAILYRHFIANAPDLDPWFEAAGLERQHVLAMIAIPEPSKYTPAFAFRLDLLRRVAERVGVSVLFFDANYSPRSLDANEQEPAEYEREYHVWRYIAALGARWPKSFGRVVETNFADGFYELLSVRSLNDDTFEHPSPRPRVMINRSGSVRVYSPLGNERLYSPLWFSPLTGGDERDEARALGQFGDFGKPEADPPSGAPTLALLATTFIEHAPARHWRWHSAWPDIGEPAWWVERWRTVVAGVSTEPSGPHLPGLADFWGAIRGGGPNEGEADVLVHQRTMRVWVWHNNAIVEPQGADPISKMVAAASLVHP